MFVKRVQLARNVCRRFLIAEGETKEDDLFELYNAAPDARSIHLPLFRNPRAMKA
jgi:hypothetical protein